MSDFYEITFSDFFDFPRLNRKYHRPFSEYSSMKPIYLEDGSVKVFANVIGHKKEDVEVKVVRGEFPNKYYLTVSAETQHEHLGKITTNYKLPVLNKIAKVVGVVENGLLELTIEFDKTADPDVEVSIS